MKKIILIGPMGFGKSTTGNILLDDNYFTTGNDLGRVTTEIKSRQSEDNSLLVVDCPGFGDATDYSIFYNEIHKFRESFLNMCPIDAFVLVIKFDCDKSPGFLKAAEEFVSCFGSQAISSLMVLCIQGNEKRRYSNDDFEKIFNSCDGFLYLKGKNRNLDVPYCLWDNFKPFKNQKAKLENIISNLQPFTKLMFEYSFELIEKEKKRIADEKRNQNDKKKSKCCII